MALCALCRRVAPRQREIRRVVIECSIPPSARRVALGTIMTEISLHVIWILRCIEVARMTIPARARQICKHIVAVALVACPPDVPACEREPRCTVIECRRPPGSCGMTRCTVVAEVSGNVIGISWLGKLLLVTLIAIGEGKLVVVVCMTRLALRACMPAGQRKPRRGVIKRCGSPPRCCVALHAVGAEIPLHVVRVVRARKSGTMAIHTVRRGAGILIVLMALGARHCLMRTGQRKTTCAMIKTPAGPGICGVARLAIRRETHGCVIRIGCRCVIGLMTGNALLRCGFEHLVLMARRALCRHMRAREGKRGLCVVEPFAPHQCRYLMALNAVR